MQIKADPDMIRIRIKLMQQFLNPDPWIFYADPRFALDPYIQYRSPPLDP